MSSESRSQLALAVTMTLMIAAAAGLGAFSITAAEADEPAAAPPATAVEVARVPSRKVVDWQRYSGRLEAVERVEIRPQVSGQITRVHFQDGSLVKKGDPLFTIDPRPFQAALDQARASLAAAEARAAFTASELARSERLLADNAIARRDHESRQNAAREADANLLAARAAVEAAKLNLAYTSITAPVSGRVSRAEVTAGNVVAAGAASPALTSVVSVAKLYAAFDVDEQTYLRSIAASRQGKAAPVFLGLASEDGYPRQGQVSSVDNRIDASSGTIRVRAVFDNPDGMMLPGLYARIRLGGTAEHEAVLVDERAVSTDQDKRFVLVLDDSNHAQYREVRLGAVQDGLRVVDSGLKAGERIVVNGLQRVRPGALIAPTEVPMQAPGSVAPKLASAAHG
ncbi:efflux RND transporter periplasmic adaptor subunit [Uliginosibacterium paludis]|uniref:Efflux RND transporter periplasmic adaptor subunit n=1 Tax=Uliginosibacterium paludis TaxID=1615952 RepID=A0ABV2CP75_9RHOO